MTTTKKRTTTKAASLELPKYPFAFEVLDLVSRQRSKAKKVEVLKKYEHPSLKAVFIWNFDETIKSALPPGDVPYTPNEAPKGTEHTLLEKEGKKLYYFFKGGADNLPALKIESMFIALLEGLHADEAQVVISAINKSLHKKFRITKAVVEEAFPSIKWGNRGRK